MVLCECFAYLHHFIASMGITYTRQYDRLNGVTVLFFSVKWLKTNAFIGNIFRYRYLAELFQ